MRKSSLIGLVGACAISVTTMAMAQDGAGEDASGGAPAPPADAANPAPAADNTGEAAPPADAKPKADGDKDKDKDDDDKKKDDDDDDRSEILWLNGELGYQSLNFTALSADGNLLLGLKESTEGGTMVGAAVGLRLWILALGVRLRSTSLSNYNYFTVGPEGQLHIPIGPVELYGLMGLNYATLGSASATNLPNSDNISVRGLSVRAGAGLDIYLNKWISIGALGTIEVTGMTRPGLSTSEFNNLTATGNINTDDPNAIAGKQEEFTQAQAQAEGSGWGYAWAASAVVGIHF